MDREHLGLLNEENGASTVEDPITSSFYVSQIFRIIMLSLNVEEPSVYMIHASVPLRQMNPSLQFIIILFLDYSIKVTL